MFYKLHIFPSHLTKFNEVRTVSKSKSGQIYCNTRGCAVSTNKLKQKFGEIFSFQGLLASFQKSSVAVVSG